MTTDAACDHHWTRGNQEGVEVCDKPGCGAAYGRCSYSVLPFADRNRRGCRGYGDGPLSLGCHGYICPSCASVEENEIYLSHR